MKRILFLTTVIVILICPFVKAQSIELSSRMLYHDLYNAVVYTGDYVYCGGNYGLQIFHLTNNISLELVNTCYYNEGPIKGMTLDAGYVFIVTESGLTVLEISDQVNPSVVSRLEFNLNEYYDLRYANSTLFIASWANVYNAWMYMIDVADPLNPVYIGGIPIEVYYISMFINNNLLFIVSQEWDVTYIAWEIYDISDPYHVHLEYSEHLDYGYGIFSIAAYYDFAYLNFFNQYTRIYYITDPSMPELLAEDSTMLLSDDMVFADSLGYNGTAVYNFADPLHPRKISDIQLNQPYRGFFFNNDKSAIVSSNEDYEYCRLDIIDWSNVTSPSSIADYYPPGRICDAAINDEYAYIANREYGLLTLDISDPLNPFAVNFTTAIGNVEDIKISGNLGYYRLEHGFGLFDLSNPADPQFLSYYSDYHYNVYDVCIDSTFAYLVRRESSEPYINTIGIFDIHNPASPLLIQTVDIDEEAYTTIMVDNNLAYLADNRNGMGIYDVHDPYSPEQIGLYSKHSHSHEFDIEYPYLYFASYYNGIEIVNIENPTNPYFVSESDSGSFRSSYINVQGQYAFTSHSQSLSVYDVSDPYNLSYICSYSPSDVYYYARNPIQVRDEFMYDAAGNLFQILRFTPTGSEEVSRIPNKFTLSPNYPNPFNAATTISYTLPQQSQVTLDIYDILGRKVRTLYNGKQTSGEHSVIWNAEGFASGIYLYKLTAGEYEKSAKMMLVK